MGDKGRRKVTVQSSVPSHGGPALLYGATWIASLDASRGRMKTISHRRPESAVGRSARFGESWSWEYGSGYSCSNRMPLYSRGVQTTVIESRVVLPPTDRLQGSVSAGKYRLRSIVLYDSHTLRRGATLSRYRTV